MGKNPEILRNRILFTSKYLKKQSMCYYVLDYLRYGEPDNPDFILTLKNTYNDEALRNLEEAKEQVKDILTKWTPAVMRKAELASCTMVCVPRAKEQHTYADTQLYLLEGVSEAAQLLRRHGVTDGAKAIERVKNTKTTHLRAETMRKTATGNQEANTGDAPYPGITKDTCEIDTALIRGKNILLVDDIYTGGVNVDEDCIQALYDAGAAKVVLFTLSCTTPRKENA